MSSVVADHSLAETKDTSGAFPRLDEGHIRALEAHGERRRRHHAARPAPRRPEVDEHRNGRVDRGVERLRVGLRDPRQGLMAVAAARHAVG